MQLQPQTDFSEVRGREASAPASSSSIADGAEGAASAKPPRAKKGGGRGLIEGKLFEALRIIAASEEETSVAGENRSLASSEEWKGDVSSSSCIANPLLDLVADELMLAFLSSPEAASLAALLKNQRSFEELRQLVEEETASLEESVASTLVSLSVRLSEHEVQQSSNSALADAGERGSDRSDKTQSRSDAFATDEMAVALASKDDDRTSRPKGVEADKGRSERSAPGLSLETRPFSSALKERSESLCKRRTVEPSSSEADVASLLSALRFVSAERSLRPPPEEGAFDAETDAALKEAFSDCPDGVMTDVEVFRDRVVVPLLGLGVYMAKTLFRRIAGDDSQRLSLSRLKEFWKKRLVLKSKDPSLNDDFPVAPLPRYPPPPSGLEQEHASQWRFSSDPPKIERGSLRNFMGAVASEESPDRIYPQDLFPWVQEVVDLAPDMDFLRCPESAEFVGKFVESVVARIMFYADVESKGFLNMKDLRRSPLVHVWVSLHPGVELSAVRHFFSYDHFYVLYSAFNQLDDDEDALIERSQVAKGNASERMRRYHGFSISSLVESRIFSQAVRKLESPVPNRMTFADWIWFVLLYHEVTLPKAICDWFALLDLNGDGLIDESEVRAFYDSQAERLRSQLIRPGAYADFLCQAFDALGVDPDQPLTVRDLLRDPVAAAMFISCLVKREYFCAFEEGDAVIAYVAGPPSERRLFSEFS